MPVKTEKITGQCPFDPRTYCGKPAGMPCYGCYTFAAKLTAIQANRCRNCGADLAEWYELYGEEHRCYEG